MNSFIVTYYYVKKNGLHYSIIFSPLHCFEPIVSPMLCTSYPSYAYAIKMKVSGVEDVICIPFEWKSTFSTSPAKELFSFKSPNPPAFDCYHLASSLIASRQSAVCVLQSLVLRR